MTFDAHPAVFVGRLREIAALDAAVVRADEGKGGLTVVAGPPGIGKTALAAELARRARARGAEVAAGRCSEAAGTPPFWPWRELIARFAGARDDRTLAADLAARAAALAVVVPEIRRRLPEIGIPPLIGEEQSRARFFDAVTDTLRHAAVTRTLVLVLEDVHAADPSSLLLLQYLAERVASARIVLVATARTIGFVADRPFAGAAELVRGQPASTLVELAGLEVAAVATLMAATAGTPVGPAVARRVHARTEGNPLYVVEVARTLRSPDGRSGDGAVPTTVRVAVARHSEAVAAPVRATMTVAALFGREFDAAAVADATALPRATVTAHVETALANGLVAPLADDRDRYRFAHGLFAESLLDGLSGTHKADLHQRVARTLARIAHREDTPSEIAEHWFSAGPSGRPDEAVAWAHRAAMHAREILAYEEAARWYQRGLTAIGWTATPDERVAAELWLGLGEAEKSGGRLTEARAAFAKAADLARANVWPDVLTRAALGHAPPVNYGDQAAPDPSVTTLLEEAIASWDGRDASLHARALARLGDALIFGDPTVRADHLTAALAMAERLGDPAALRFTLAATLSSHMQRMSTERAATLAKELIRLGEEARDLEALAVGHLWRAVHLIELGDRTGTAHVDDLMRVAAELRQPIWEWRARIVAGMRHIMAGRFGDAERTAHEAYAIAKDLLPYAGYGYFVAQLLMIHCVRGEPAYTVEYRSVYEHHPDPGAVSPLAWAASEAGRPEDARAIVERLVTEDLAVIRTGPVWRMACVFLAEGCAALGDRVRSAPLYDALVPHGTEWLLWAEGAPLGPVSYFLGILAHTMGRLDAAAQHFEHALAFSRRMESAPFVARCLYAHARLLLQRGDSTASPAAELLAEARAIASAIDMPGLVRRIDALGIADTADGNPTATANGTPAGVSVVRACHDGNGTVFAFEGGSWLIAYDGVAVRLRDARGLHYLATLLRHPERTFAAAELAHAAAPAAGPNGADDAERARITVTKAIGNALTRIAAAHPSLGAHLRATVRRGYECVYAPDPRDPPVWAATIGDCSTSLN